MHNLCLSLHTRLTWSSVCCICGRSGEASDVEVNNIENYGDDVEAMLLLGATPDIELDENAVDDVYRGDDDTPEYEELYDDGVDVDAEF